MPTFKCFFCDQPASLVAFYSKAYPNKVGYTQENPELVCESCYRTPQIINQLSPIRGGDEGMFSFRFEAIGKWTPKQLAFHLSKKLWEINHFSDKHWRKLLWRIHFICQPPKQSGAK